MSNKLVASKSCVFDALVRCEADKLHLVVSPLASLIDFEARTKLVLLPKRWIALFLSWNGLDVVHRAVLLKVGQVQPE